MLKKSKKELHSARTSSSFGHLSDLPESEISSLSAPSAAFWVGVMLQSGFQVLPGTKLPLQLPPLHRQPELSTSGKNPPQRRIQVKNAIIMVGTPR